MIAINTEYGRDKVDGVLDPWWGVKGAFQRTKEEREKGVFVF